MDKGLEKGNSEQVIRLRTVIPQIVQYIEENYTEEIFGEVCPLPCVEEVTEFSVSVADESSEYVEKVPSERKYILRKDKKKVARKEAANPDARRLEDVIAETEETFSQSLLRLISQKGLKDSDVYNRANISRQLFSKIRKETDYQPTKKTVFALLVAMELNIDESLDLLAKAGLTFSPSKKEDLVVRFFIETENYDMFLLNEVLEEFGLPTLI